jgi:thioredoxin 1
MGRVETPYEAMEPGREDVDRLQGPVLLEFGSPWCGYCVAARGPIGRALEGHPGVRHIRIADGRGRRLGRSFGVKLWPTLVFLSDGAEVAKLVRPGDAGEITQALARIDPAPRVARGGDSR